VVLLFNSFAYVMAMELPVTTSDPFKEANDLYDRSKWEEAAEKYTSVFKNTDIPRELSEDAIKKEADSFGMTSEQLIRGHVNYGDVLFAFREFPQAFAHWQYRIHDGQFGRKPLVNEWDGSDPEGKTIVVYSERERGAFGDTFFATPLLEWLKSCGAKVIFVPQNILKKLYSTPDTAQSTYVSQVIVREEELPSHDAETYVRSIFGPYCKAREESSFPIIGNFLSGKKELPVHVQEKLREHVGKLLIGFWWRSSGTTSKAADYRSLDRDPGAKSYV